jgi:CDP-glycerol glycerophosphotransferase (TagB/SpsB family)
MLVFGNFSKQLLVGKSYPSERVVVAGHPEYEFDPNILTADKKVIRQELHLDQSKKTILVATTKLQKKYGYEDYDVIMVSALAKELGNRSDIQIILKPHPLEDPAIYESIINEKAAANFLIRKDPIQRLVLASDVFVTTMSTTAIEATVLDRPVIIAQIPHNPLSFTLDGGAVEAELEKLPDMALKVINGERDFVKQLIEKRAEFKRQHFNFPDARTRKKVAGLLLES